MPKLRTLQGKRFLGTQLVAIATGCLVAVLNASAAFAESVVPVGEGESWSIVVEENAFYTISGGALSSDGENLFHQLEQLNLSAGEVANFLSTSEINNILALVRGGEASFIDGLLQVSGGDSNLFLINPAGVLFGENSRLNIPGNLTVTTADQVGFGSEWLSVYGDNAFSNAFSSLVGSPDSFVFTASEPGTIVNEGDLALKPASQLTILGGSVVNTGTLSTAGGTITIAAVPGQQRVRLSPVGGLLSLEVATVETATVPGSPGSIEPIPFDPLSLPALLTGGEATQASQLVVNADGTVRLSGADVKLETATSLISGTIETGHSAVGGEILVVGDRIALINAALNTSGTASGGTIRIGGNYQGQGSGPRATRTWIDSQSRLTADALRNGQGGQVVVWADEATKFEGSISAQGGAEGGDGGQVEVSGRLFLEYLGTVSTNAVNGQVGSLLLDPTNIVVVAAGGTASDLSDVDNFLDADLGPGASTTIDASLLDGAIANVTLQATNNITFNAPINIAAPQVGLRATANNTINVNADITTNGGALTLIGNADGIDAGAVTINNSTLNTQGGNLTLTGQGENDALNDGIFVSGSSLNAGAGNLTLTGIGQTSELTSNSAGVWLENSTLTTTTGNLTVTGTGASGVSANDGITVRDGTTLQTGNGNLTLQGQGSNNVSTIDNQGITILGNGTALNVTGSGQLRLTGTGGNGSARNRGILIGSQASVQAGAGGIVAVGTGGGTGNDSEGITLLNGATVATTNNGDLTLRGFGTQFNPAGNGNQGVQIFNDGSPNPMSVTTDGGDLLIEGVGGGSLLGNNGVLISRAGTGGLTIATEGNGALTIIGTAADGTSRNEGVLISEGAGIRTQNGTLSITGTGGNGSQESNHGVSITEVSSTSVSTVVESTGSGNIVVDGTAQTTNNTSGILLGAGSIVRTVGSGGITLRSTAPATNLFSFAGSIESANPLTLSTPQDLTLSDLVFSTPLILSSPNGDITTGNITTEGLVGQPVTLTAPNGSITTGDINTSGTTGDGGAVTLAAQTEIISGFIDTSSLGSNAGAVNLDPIEDIQISGINATAPNGLGGTVDITAGRYFRATNSFVDFNGRTASISTAGGLGGGGITVRHGGSGFVPFAIGEASLNGTQAAITTGNSTLAAPQTLLGPLLQGDIQIVTAPTEEPISELEDRPLSEMSEVIDNGEGSAIAIDPTIVTVTYEQPEEIEAAVNILAENFKRQYEDYYGDEAFSSPPSPNPDPEPENASLQEPANSPETDSSQGTTQETATDSSQETTQETATEDETTSEGEADNTGSEGESARDETDIEDNVIEETQQAIRQVEAAAPGVKPAILYVFFAPGDQLFPPTEELESLESPASTSQTLKSNGLLPTLLAQTPERSKGGCQGRENDQLFMVLVTSEEEIVSKHVPGASCKRVREMANQFRKDINTLNDNYLAASQQLYKWLIAPFENDLETGSIGENGTPQAISNLVFIMDQGLRSLPLAALHDGDQFLIEKDYSIGLMPSLSLTETDYKNIQNAQILSTGISDFSHVGLSNLPAVPFELDNIFGKLSDEAQSSSSGEHTSLRNQDATIEQLRTIRPQNSAEIVHIATHADFRRGKPEESYIQFWNEPLRLSEVRQMGWEDPPVELLVLSACETATDSYEAELGFAGFANQAGVKSVLASLWRVSDIGTAALMIEFYTRLRTEPIKAEALRQAQLAMLNRETYLTSDRLLWSGGERQLPEELLKELGTSQSSLDLSHPFYWSGFTLVGNPW